MQKKGFLLACLVTAIDCFGQQYPFVQYTPKDGLVNSRVRKACQDSKGRMYFLTQGGLSVYDGARFRNYSTQNGLANDVTNDILETGEDSLLVATNAGHLNTLVNGRIGNYKTADDFCPLINQFYTHTDKRIYITSDDGLFAFENKKFKRLNTASPANGDTLGYFGAISGSGNYLLLTSNSVRRNKGLFLYDIQNDRIADMLPGLFISYMGKDLSGRIWISTATGCSNLDPTAIAGGKLSLVEPQGGYRVAKDYPANNIRFGQDNAWLVSNKEIVQVDQTGSVMKIPLPPQAISSVVQDVFIDHENTIWLSIDGAGVFKMPNSRLQIFNSPFEKTGAGNATGVYNDIAVTWFSTSTDQLFRKCGNQMTAYTSNVSPSPKIFLEKNGQLFAHDEKNTYVAEFDSSKRSISFRPQIRLMHMESFGKTMLPDPYGYLITCMNTGLGVWKDEEMAFLVLTGYSDVVEGLRIDANGLLWVVKRYSDTEVYSFHPGDSSNYLHVEYRFSTRKIGGSPRSFVIDRKGLIWIGTRHNGLFAYRHDKDQLVKIHHFHAANGLTDNFVTTLTCDSSNNIIAGTQTGVDRIVSLADNSCRIENLSKGSNYFEFIGDVWADKTNAFALANSGAFLRILPVQQPAAQPKPALLLEELRVNAKLRSPGANNFSFNENNFSLYVAAPSFVDEKQVGFSYLLEGSANPVWSDTSSANAVINLANLSPGKYSLRIKAIFGSMPYPPSELEYSFVIAPPWWQAWWFRLLVAATAIWLIIMAVQFYYRGKLKKQKAILARQPAIEKERAHIATGMSEV